MVGVLLGLPGQWAEDELESSDHYTTKIGGLPDWPPLPDDIPKPDLLNCCSCGSKLSLVAQVYSPISTEEERTLYIFGCLMPKCGASEQSWRALSVQKAIKEKESIDSEDLPVASPKDTPSKTHWLDDDGDDDDEDFDFESLAKAIAEAATTVASNSKKPKSKPSGNASSGTKAKPSPLKSVDQVKVETGAVLPCFYICTKEEKVSTKDVERVSMSYSSMSIKDKETSKNDESEAEEAWEDEKYEYDKALNADRTYLKFKKRLDANSEQCFRYSYGGKPLLAREDLKSPDKCRHCDSPMVFEMQLMSPLIYFLHEGVVDEGLKQSLDCWDWMTLIVYTCSKSCATAVNGDWVVAEGCIAVQGILPVSSDDDGVAKKEENPSLVKIICGIFGKKFPPSSWELIQGAMKKIQTKLYPPNLDFRSNSANNNKDKEGEDKGEKVKEAATRSLEVSKEAIEESATLAGGVIGEAVHKTAEKVTKQTSHDEM
ncbi:hypothetical protein IGI04_024017 [Brassica rapa subsp. trilocularis]|uniref:Programmed cell death protein 2 C-terminal domain-containing protein n=1 Tax=Brassica rapa subsp. trilocularis TaxID=1813537 RepID=A0ABQ7M5I8_BRACM|nr:hypothetical protein IGI04_024017 [Brassica rapa subsp. trilocularis]